jgi:ferredoxin-NADP reductase
LDLVAVKRGIRVIPVRGSTEGSGHRLDLSHLEPVRVTSNVEIAPRIYRLSFRRQWDFVPGQCIALTVDPLVAARFYSIASGTGDSQVEVLYDLVPEGTLTPRLAALAPEEELLCSRPFGAFQDAKGPSCWIGAGTGIAPFLSMARSGATEGKLLVHGSRSIAGLIERSFFSRLLDGRYVPCCTRETDIGVYFGRPTAWLSEKSLPVTGRFLLCGNSGMVVDARDILIGRGVRFVDVIAEIYF